MMEEAKGIVKNLENISKLNYVMSLDGKIKDTFDIIQRCRKGISNKEIREAEKRYLLLAEDLIDERKVLLSDTYFSDDRETFSKYEQTCLEVIKLCRDEIALYE